MRDIDAIQRHEFEQQQLVTGIIDELHSQTRDDEDYQAKFRDLAICIIYDLDRRHPLPHDYDKTGFYSKVVLGRIGEFRGGRITDIERKYLLCKVLDKVVADGVGPFYSAYTREELAAA